MRMRYYQGDLIDRIRPALRDHQHVCAQSPTGSGKSKTFIYMGRMAAAKGLTVLIITEAIKIFDQLHAEYTESHNIDSNSRLHTIKPGHAYVAMSQTLVRRTHLVEQFHALGSKLLIINDECHIGTATKLLQQLRGALLIGFTATPAWQWARHLSVLYKHLVVGPQVSELIKPPDGNQYLCNYKHFGPVAANLDDLKIKAGEYTEESQEHAFEGDGVYNQLEKDLKTKPFKKCIIFCSSIKHCETLYKVLFARGFSVVQYHSGLDPRVAKYNLRMFMIWDSCIDICISIQSLTKGFDFPAIDLVVLMRATRSLPLYLQMIGRGSRIIPGIKTWFTCIDYGGNWKRFGFWFDDRDWDELFQPVERKTSVISNSNSRPVYCSCLNSCNNNRSPLKNGRSIFRSSKFFICAAILSKNSGNVFNACVMTFFV